MRSRRILKITRVRRKKWGGVKGRRAENKCQRRMKRIMTARDGGVKRRGRALKKEEERGK